ncbi:DUF2726 domain-containing protein [Sedimentitalea sp. HM32M-2]|uniref:DUF2726 domain-containing protein n=1 Tax=Sedimentitalea sp. HM32M-2 TaxID=3351566 RepID=UPI003645CDD7
MRRQPQAESADKLIAADPLQAIARVRFERIRLLNPAESRLLPIIEHAAQAADSGLRVTTRTSLGDIIAPRHGCASSDDRRHACATINSRQLDFAVFDRFGLCVCAIDVQRRVHAINQPRTDQPARDAIKTEALSRAGVPLIEIAPDIQAPQLQRQLQRVLAPQPSASQHRHSAIQV